jgi:hypothetical protein
MPTLFPGSSLLSRKREEPWKRVNLSVIPNFLQQVYIAYIILKDTHNMENVR